MNMIFKPTCEECKVSPILDKKTYYTPKVKIEYPALLKMKCYVDGCDKEIGWLGLVEKKDGTYIIKDVEIMKQTVTATSVDIKEEGLQEYAERLMARGNYDNLDKIRCWGHSHVNMQVYPSSTDEETFKEYYQDCDYFIRIIANKKGDLKLDVAELTNHVLYTDVKWETDIPAHVVSKENEIKGILTAYETSMKELDAINDNDISQYKEITDKEISQYVTHQSYANTWKTQNSKPYNMYDYSSWYDWEDDEYTAYIERNNNEIQENCRQVMGIYDVPEIVICRKTKDERMEFIDEVFSDEDIRLINALEVDELVRFCGDDEEFINYHAKHWKKLKKAAQEYVKLVG